MPDIDVVRIPLTIVATGSGQKTDGVLVAVAVAQLDALEVENERLRSALADARAELVRWGWGDERFGVRPQEKSVVDTIAKIDGVLVGAIGPEAAL